MKNQLTKSEIEVLFKFVRSKYVRYIDVQYELVDHLATGIEHLRATDNNISLDQALEKVYSTFPITGFSNIIQQKESRMSRYWWRMIFKSLIKYLRPNRLVICVLIYFSLVYLILNFDFLAVIPTFFLIVVLSLHTWLMQPETYTARFTDYSNKYLVVKMFRDSTMGNLWVTIAAVNLLTNHLPIVEGLRTPSWQIFLLAGVLLQGLIWIHASIYDFPELLRKALKSKYPHLNIEL